MEDLVKADITETHGHVKELTTQLRRKQTSSETWVTVQSCIERYD